MDGDSMLAINDNELGEFTVGLMDYSDELGEIFTKVDSKMSELTKYFGGKAATDLQAQYKSFRENYQIVRNNVISYSDDLISLITQFHEGSRTIALQVNKAADEVLQESQKIEQL